MKKPPFISNAEKIETALRKARNFIVVVESWRSNEKRNVPVFDWAIKKLTSGGEIEAIDEALNELGRGD